jgi:hypothetical protein
MLCRRLQQRREAEPRVDPTGVVGHTLVFTAAGVAR